jgi:hypothetical protein
MTLAARLSPHPSPPSHGTTFGSPGGERGKARCLWIPSQANEVALSPLRIAALRCSGFVRGSNERIPAGRGSQALSLISLRALALKAVFFGLLFFDSGLAPSALRAGFAVRTRRSRAWASKRKVTRASHGTSFASPAGDRNARCVPQGLPSVVSGPLAVTPHPKTDETG